MTIPWGFWYLVLVYVRKICCLQCMWTEFSLIESISMLYITPTSTSSMQKLPMQGMQQNWEKSWFRCPNNTWNVESNYILLPSKYLIIIVNQLRYINSNVTKDKYSIPMDMAVLALYKFSLQATVDHHGPSMYWVWNDWYQKLLYYICSVISSD